MSLDWILFNFCPDFFCNCFDFYQKISSLPRIEPKELILDPFHAVLWDFVNKRPHKESTHTLALAP